MNITILYKDRQEAFAPVIFFREAYLQEEFGIPERHQKLEVSMEAAVVASA
jgi:hypothetical protein